MTSEIEQLHTAIRRYCIDRYDYWTRKYSELASVGKNRAGTEYTREALRTFPRYNVLKAILIEVERHRPEEFASLDEAKRAFTTIAATAQSVFTKPPNDLLAQQTMNEERDALAQFIANLSQAHLSAVAPLFYRRVLTAAESSLLEEKLRQVWGLTQSYWYPLSDRTREDLEAFQDTYFENEIGIEKLRTILSARGVETFFELREDRIDYEAELSILRPFYNGNEGFWCDAGFSWIIYASHESSITIGGWLLTEVKSVWPNWHDRVWTSPFFD